MAIGKGDEYIDLLQLEMVERRTSLLRNGRIVIDESVIVEKLCVHRQKSLCSLHNQDNFGSPFREFGEMSEAPHGQGSVLSDVEEEVWVVFDSFAELLSFEVFGIDGFASADVLFFGLFTFVNGVDKLFVIEPMYVAR